MGFGFHNVEHAFASIAKDLVKTATTFSFIASRVEKAAPEIEAITGAIYPPAVLIERTAFGLLGIAANTASAIGEATDAKGLNLELDAQSIQELKQIAQYLKTRVASFEDFSKFEDKGAPAQPKNSLSSTAAM
jgi:hypothetical protein